METGQILAFTWLGTVFLISCKMLIDQYKLLKIYRKEVDPPYPILPGETSKMYKASAENRVDLFGLVLTKHRLRITFSKHNNHPEIGRLAQLVRHDLMAAVGAGIGGFVLIVAIMFMANKF